MGAGLKICGDDVRGLAWLVRRPRGVNLSSTAGFVHKRNIPESFGVDEGMVEGRVATDAGAIAHISLTVAICFCESGERAGDSAGASPESAPDLCPPMPLIGPNSPRRSSLRPTRNPYSDARRLRSLSFSTWTLKLSVSESLIWRSLAR